MLAVTPWVDFWSGRRKMPSGGENRGLRVKAKVEEEVIKKLVENLRTEGIEGSVASVKGLDLSPEGIVMKNDIHLRRFEQI